MSSASGSSTQQMKVVAHRPWLAPAIGLAWVASTILVAVLAAWFSSERERTINRDLSAVVSAMEAELAEKDTAVQGLRRQLAVLRTGAEVDRQSAEAVRVTVVELQDKIDKLEGDIRFYRGLMEPGDEGEGLKVGSVSVAASEQPGRYRYRFVIQQIANNHKLLTGTLKVELTGLENGQPLRYSLGALTDGMESEEVKLRFKYFQTVEGELSLPEGFEPQSLELLVKSGKSTKIEQRFAWQAIEEV